METGGNGLLQSAMPIIRYGSEIVLRHEPTGEFLRSPGIPYRHPKSSQQDQVTCSSKIDSKSYWFVKPPYGYPDDYLYGQPIQNGAVLCLENRASRKHLHSHGNAPSPVSNQNEVTCFANRDGSGDLNDNWILQIEGKKTFETDTRFRLIHTLTSCALHSHAGASHKDFTSGEQEVTGFPNRDENDMWTVQAVFGPIIPPVISSAGKAASWLSILNLAASIASITGVTFLFLGATLKTAAFAQILSTIIAAMLIVGCVLALILLLLEGHRLIKLSLRSKAWLVVLWLVGLCVAIIATLYLWNMVANFSTSHIQPLLQNTFGIK